MDYTQCTPNPRKNKHLRLIERVKIELMLQEGKTAYAIAKSLQRSINTILHEIRRGSVDQIKAGKKFESTWPMSDRLVMQKIEKPAVNRIKS